MLCRGSALVYKGFCRFARVLESHIEPGVRAMSTLPPKKILVTRKIPKQCLELIQRNGWQMDVWDHEEPIPRPELLQRVPGIHGLYCLLTDRIDKELLDTTGPQLEVVSTMSVGYDHVDAQELKKRGILLGNTPDVLTSATAELTIALLLATSRRLMEAVEEAKSGGWGPWKPFWMCGSSLEGSTVGIFGFGRIGQAVAKRLAPFGVCRFLYSSRSPKLEACDVGAVHVDFDTLLKESDFVIASCALTSETKEIFNLEAFRKMKKTAIFINPSRGGVVQQDDLYTALTTGTIQAAGLDVTSPEPLPTSNPLFKLKNCVILPHIGSAENNTRTTMATLAARNLECALKKEPMPAQAQL